MIYQKPYQWYLLISLILPGRVSVWLRYILKCRLLRIYAVCRIGIDPSRIPYETQNLDEDRSSSDESISEVLGKVANLGLKVVPLAESKVQQYCSNISKAISSLYRLSSAILNVAPENRFLESERTDNSHFESGDIENVLEKFPFGELSLIEKLGKANTKRRQILQYLERKNKSAGKHVFRSAPSPKEFPQAIASQHKRISRKATSQMSMFAEGSLQIPPRPEGDDSNGSMCPYCHKDIVVDTENLWR